MVHATNECSLNGDAHMRISDAEPQTDESILIRLEVQQAAASAVSPKSSQKVSDITQRSQTAVQRQHYTLFR